MTPKAWVTKTKTEKGDYIILKNFCASNGPRNKMKMATYEMGESIYKSYI